jgi:hypothetical protein
MLRRALRILACCLVTLMAYWVYSLVAVPWIEPSIQAQSRPESVPRDRQPKLANLDSLADLFPEGSWELDNPKLLKTEQGMLLFQDYQPVDGSQLELRPCTLVFFSEKAPGKPRGRPIVMRAPQRAVLEFEGNVDLLKARLGRLRGGRLEGEISIYTPAAYSEPDQQLRIVTRNIQITPQRIWTPHELDFQMGRHHGKGRQLIIELGAPQRSSSGSQPGLQLGSIRSLELTKIDKISLVLPGGGPLGSQGGQPLGQLGGSEPMPTDVPPPESASETTVPVELTCDGPFRFEFQQNTASFEENVDVVRLNPEGPADTLKCHRLTFHFGPSNDAAAATRILSAEAPAKTEPTTAAQTGRRKPQAPKIDRVVAVGHPVQLVLASMDAGVRTELLEYRFATRTLHLRDDRGVRLRHQHHTVTAPELEYQLAENPRDIGRLWAAGPGRFVSQPPQVDQPPMEAAWNGELRVTPEGDEHVISLRNGASANMPDMGGFSAERLFIWLRQLAPPRPAPRPDGTANERGETANERGETAPGTAEPANRPGEPDNPPDETVNSPGETVNPRGETGNPPDATGNPPGETGVPQNASPGSESEVGIQPGPTARAGRRRLAATSIQPTKLLAEGQVRFDSPQLTGATNRLEVWFRAADAGAAPPERTNSADGRAGAPVRPPSSLEPADGTVQQLRLQGELIRLQLINSGRWSVEHVSVIGDVLLSQRPDQANVEPLTVRGDSLEVDNGLAGNGQLDITGRPASVSARGLSVVGPNLHLRQRDNRLWMDGPGSMTLPPTGRAANANASLPVSTSSGPGLNDRPGGMLAGGLAGSPLTSLGGASIPITIRWRGGMQFNGHTAAFQGDVETGGQQRMQDGTMNDLSITGAMLEVELTDMLSFSDPSAGKVELKQLRFLADQNGVRLTNQGRGADGLPQSIDRLLVGRLTLEGTSGLFRADGPGWISTTRYGRDGFLTPGGDSSNSPAPRPGGSLPPNVQLGATPPPRTDVLPRLVHLFASFADGITGNMYQREFHFMKRVQVIYGPVTSWDAELRGRNLDQLPPGSVVMDCDRLAVADMGQGGPAQLELLATGNTQVEGMTHQGRFVAQAHRLSYVQAKDLLVMEGDGRRDATWQGRRMGGPGLSRAAARKIVYSRRDGRVEVDSFQYLNLGQ